MKIKIIFVSFIFSFGLLAQEIPEGFVYLKEIIPTLVVDLRYASPENFTGKVVRGYTSQQVVGTKALAIALNKVQNQLKSSGLGLKVFDAYRPQRAVDAFMLWTAFPLDTLKKQEYYPKLKKDHLFELGYIAEKSGHTRGSTVDLTLIYLTGENKGKELDMGGEWDFFGPRSHITFQKINSNQLRNRQLLRNIMIKHGFNPYAKEWWHFSLINEPFPNTYFDFVIPN
ncbi:MAG: M15 family metallopeptidase [Flavobacteriaceae bacterium]|nr:M15 family metallopeptidase [Flavobacteriaceae bacterium]MDG1911712.1 M15 family metallopeptidase [Flavobacteriaceae bacterium]